MVRELRLSLLMGLSTVLCACTTQSPELSSAELADLYRVALEELAPQLDFPDAVVVHPESHGDRHDLVPDSAPDAGPWLLERIDALSEETWSDFVQENRSPAQLPSDVTAALGYPISEAPWDIEDKEGRTQAYRALEERVGPRFTIVRLSRPGVSRDGTQAVVHATTRCNLAMCGAGWYIFCERLGGEWRVAAIEGSWVE